MFNDDGKRRDARPVLEACAVFGENGDGVLCADASGAVRYANAAMARILARPVGELLGRDALTLIGSDCSGDEGATMRTPSGVGLACRHYPVSLDDGMPGTLFVLGGEGQPDFVCRPQLRFDMYVLVGVEALRRRRHPHFAEIGLPCADSGNAGEDGRRETFPWSEAYETGIPQIDLQHRRLADLANRLGWTRHGAHSIAGDLLDEIADYTDCHFRCEEAFMSRYGVVDAHADLHRRRHGEGLSLMRGRIASCHAGNGDPLAFCAEFARWLASHMLAEDKSLGEQIAAIDGGVAPVEAYRSTMLSAALECR